MAISAPGLGSNLDVNAIVSQLMAVETRPLSRLATKEAGFQAKLTALGSLKGSLSAFQTALDGLNSMSKFQAMSGTSGDAKIAKISTSSDAAAGSYTVNISQLAKSQALVSQGQATSTATIGTGAATTLNFEFGAIEGGSHISTGARLATSTAAAGIPANALTINGTVISTDSTVNSARLLAERINLSAAATGVTASAEAAESGSLGSFTTIGGAGNYSLTVGGVSIISGAAAGTDAQAMDAALASATGSLNAAGITVTGSAVQGDLSFTRADGSNIVIQESGAGASGGFTATVGIGKTVTHTSSISLTSAAAINVGGSNPALAGLTAGVQPNTYSGASFIQNADIASGTVTIDSSNNTLQGIRDAINKAGLGITASIVSDGSASPHRLILTSTKTGASSSMKISVDGDAAISNLLAYDPAGTQQLKQTGAAQDTLFSVNGVPMRSDKHEITNAIQGVTLTAVAAGTTTVNVSRDTASITSSVNAFVKAYNDVNKTLKDLTAYNPETRQASALTGDSTARAIQTNIRKLLGVNVPGAAGSFTNLSEIGVSFQTDGTLSVDSSKLQKAITDNVDGIGALFATMGRSTDSLVRYKSSSSATKPGNYEVFVTSLATQGKTVGSSPAALSISQGVNDQMTVVINGVTASITLTAGSYSAESLASHLQAVINGNETLSAAGAAVVVKSESGVLTVTSGTYGASSKVSLSGNAADALLGNGRTETEGTDVAGTIGGVAALGAGQDLIGATGSATEGLRMTITGGAENSKRGTISFSYGYAQQLSGLLGNYIGSTGPLTERTTGLNNSIKDLGKQREAINQQLQLIEKRYRAQFAALDKMMSSMSQTSNYLAQQLANLPKME